MEFIKHMRKREFIEMTLKTIMALLVAFVAIILMEGMIYGVELNALYKNSTVGYTQSDKTIAYCIEIADDQYFVVYYNEGDVNEWSASHSDIKTREECEQITALEIVYHAPNAFVFSITPIHYVVMAVFILAVGGYFVYRFIALNNEYKRITDKYEKEGIIEF